MPVPDFGGLPPKPDFNDIVIKVNELVQQLRNLLMNLDSLNVIDLVAETITSGTINANVVTIEADDGNKYYRFDENGIVAFNGTNNTLDFDLNTGLLTLISVLVQSATGYPRVEINSVNNLIAAYAAANNYIGFNPIGAGNVPALSLVFNNILVASLLRSAGGTILSTFGGDPLTLQGAANINIAPAGNLQINGTNGTSGTFYVASAPNGPTTTQINFTKGVKI